MQINVKYSTKLSGPSIISGYDLLIKGSFKIKGIRKKKFEFWPIKNLPNKYEGGKLAEIESLKIIEKFLDDDQTIKKLIIEEIERILECNKNEILKWSLISQIDKKNKDLGKKEFNFELEEK